MKHLVADLSKHFAFVKVAKINKKIFIPNFLNDLLVVPIKFLVLLVVWFALFEYSGKKEIGQFTLWALILYYLMYTIIMQVTGYYRQLPYIIWGEITEGNLSKFLCRPMSYVMYHFFYGLGYTYYSAFFCIPAVLMISLFFYSGIGFMINCLLFLVSLFMGIVITFFIHLLIGFLTFWMESIFGYRDLILHIGTIFSGSILPMDFFPEIFQTISFYLPFRYMIYDPISIILYQLQINQIIMILVRQLLCIICLYVITKDLWLIGIKKYEAQGG